MRAKTVIYASQGARDPGLTDEDYATGMVAGTVAMAEDVNTYGFRSDDQLKVVSDEICNAITGQGIALNNNDNTQLSTMLKTKMGMGCLLTGLMGMMMRTMTTTPIQPMTTSIITTTNTITTTTTRARRRNTASPPLSTTVVNP